MDVTLETNNLLEKFWIWRLQNTPEFATFCGIHDYNDDLDSLSTESIEEGKVACQQFFSEAQNLLSKSNLTKEEENKLCYLVDELRTYLEGCNARGYFFSVSYLDGIQTEFSRLIDAMPLNSANDFNNIISRYNKFPRQVSQIIDIMKQGISQNMTFHKRSVAGIPDQIDLLDQLAVLKEKAQECVFYKPFLSLPDSLTDQEKEAVLRDAMNSITHNVLPAFKQLKDFMEKEYFNHTRPEIAISSLPDGKTFYQMCLDFHLSCRMTPELVHAMGLKEVDRISCEIIKVIKSLNLEMSIKDFSEKMRKDERFYFKNPEELLSAYKHLVFEKIVPLLKKVVKTIPKSKLEIRPADASMAGGPKAYYFNGSMDGSKPGVFYINTANCENSAAKYEMVTLALHEALPGHHLQGWGLYCEYLGYELGLYDDPYDHFGHLSQEMLRAVRLVVDTGIHAFGWSFDKAVEYMMDHTASSQRHIENEVKRYITIPGQACAYKVGELKLKSLREEAEKALGDDMHNEMIFLFKTFQLYLFMCKLLLLHC